MVYRWAAEADAEPFRHPSTRNVHEIDALPHFHKIRSARKQTDKQLARFVIPLVVVNRAALQINQGRRVDGKTEFAGRHGHTQRQLGIADIGPIQLVEEIAKLDVVSMTPIEALNLLYQLKQKL